MSFRSKNEDRLSYLPEEVLSYILSLMPTEFAVRSCILSKRWKNSWMMVTNLDFNDSQSICSLDWFLNFVDRVLDLCKTSQVKLFRLYFTRFMVPKSCVSKWIDKAVKLNVCELDINVQRFDLPLSLFSCKKLTKLKLFASYRNFGVLNVPPLVILPRLKTLDISVHSKRLVKAFRLINGCPVLESLSLLLLSDEDGDYNFFIPTLKRLELRTKNCTSRHKVVLNVPNLEYIYVAGMLGSNFVMEDLSSLVEATVFFRDKTFKYPIDLLKGISGAKSLSLFSLTPHVQSDLPLPKFSNLKHLQLKVCFNFQWLLVFQVLENSPGLEHLCIEEKKVGDSCWIEPESVPSCILSNLRTMKIKNCMGWKCDIQILKYMLGNAEVLKTLTITCESLSMKDELRFCPQLLKIPRASRFCEIHFVGKWLNSTSN